MALGKIFTAFMVAIMLALSGCSSMGYDRGSSSLSSSTTPDTGNGDGGGGGY
jgi:hypothetical protein